MKKIYSFIIAGAIVLFFSSQCLGVEITLRWSANSDAVDGYYIHYKPDFCCEPYASKIRVPLSGLNTPLNPDYPEYTVTGLDPNRAYYFVVSAFSITTDGEEESGFSNEVRIKAPQIVSQPVETYISSDAATIEWKTDETSDSEVWYGTVSADWGAYTQFTKDPSGVKTHSITLSLQPQTTYHYRAGSTNSLGFGPDLETDDANPSRDLSFTTTTKDTISPQFITPPFATSVTDTSASIEWKTDETANSRVDYGKTSSLGQTAGTAGTYTTYHSVDLSGLEPDTLYYLKVTSADPAGNEASYLFQFTTQVAPDTTAPIFTSPPTIAAVTDSTVSIDWTTNEPSSSKVRYGINSASWPTYPSREEDFTRVTKHRVTITGLEPEKTYYYRAGSADSSSNQTLSAEFTFKTAAAKDTLPPEITTAPTVISQTHTTATIVWNTNEPANSYIRYRAEQPLTWTDYQDDKIDSGLVTFHQVTLSNLNPETLYYFMVGSSDAEGNGPTTSKMLNFVTDAAPDTIAPQIIVPPTATAKTNQTVTLEWETDEPSNSIVRFCEAGTCPENLEEIWEKYTRDYFDPQGVTKHRVTIAGLDGDTLYYFQVGGFDAVPNGPDTDPQDNNPSKTLMVLTEPDPDAIPPQISSPPTVTAKTDVVAVIEWSTDEPSNSIVRYCEDQNCADPRIWETYPFTEIVADMVVDHAVVLTGLKPLTKYYLRVASIDEHGNGADGSAASLEIFFTTNAAEDTMAPRITVPPTVTGITHTAATIEWETDEPSNSEVRYRVVPEGGGVQIDWSDSSLNVVTTNAMVSRHNVTLTNLKREDGARRYYFMVGSTDAAGNGPNPLAVDSNNPFTPDFFYIEEARDEAAPKIISGPTVTAKDNQSAVIEWETDEPSNSIVKYDINAGTWDEFSFGLADTQTECILDDDGFEICYPIDDNGDRVDETSNNSESDAQLVTLHSVTITDLQPITTYYYRVGSTDALGNGPDFHQDITNPSPLREFATEAGSDIVAPAISNLRVFFVTNQTALITWETDEPSNSMVHYGLKIADWNNYSFEESDAGMSTSHSITITGLQPATKYYFRAASSDAKGNGPFLNPRAGNPSDEMAFLSAAGPDLTAPQISKVLVASKTDKTAVIEWTTDEPGNSQVRYDTDSNPWETYAYSENDAEMVTEHSVTLTGLSPSTLYYLRVSSTDASGNNYVTSLTDQNPSIEYNISTSTADPPSIITYPEADYPKIDFANGTIVLSYDEPNMQSATVESYYIFSPVLTFAQPGSSIREIHSTNGGSTYRLSFVSIPRHTVFTLTVWDEITDADGYSVEPATVLINDNDADDLPDDWELAVGLDPTSADTTEGQGREGDFDNDGYSNYGEFLNGTDPKDAASKPAPPQILKSLPHNGAGLSDSTWVPNNTSFAVLVVDAAGGIDIDPYDAQSNVTFTISVADGAEIDTYSVDASNAIKDTSTVRILKLNPGEPDNAVTALWIAYDRPLETIRDAFYPFNAAVDINVLIQNNAGQLVREDFSFGVESQSEHNAINNPDNLPSVSSIGINDPDMDDPMYTYDTGIQLNYGSLAGAKVIFNSDQPVMPLLMTKFLFLENADTTSEALFIEPPTIFSSPAKIILPVRDSESSPKDIGIYIYTGSEWILACNPNGSVQEGGYGWMVPNSRVNNNNSSPPTIEIKAYHTSGMQLGISTAVESTSKEEERAEASCFIETVVPEMVRKFKCR